ncbi:MAG: hypothetical protein IKC65_02380 [Lentisphaeria bacterium]|nr:hypothetical protein [Lentisphaeria bacterium]
MPAKLKAIDPGVLELACKDGSIFVSNKLQGRIFAQINGTFVHNFVEKLAASPDPDNFNNIGGNSLWPAPEGGDFAYNYPDHSDWQVQSGINTVQTATLEKTDKKAVVSKRIKLRNRNGKEIELDFVREVQVLEEKDFWNTGKLACTGYRTVDRLTVIGKCSKEDYLLSAWSLEQLPGAEGITAFGKCCAPAKDCINDDFYGDSSSRVQYKGDVFTFELGGPNRLQIAIKAAAQPVMIGSLDRNRNILVIRTTPAQDKGIYFNIADNDQKDGPYSAADMFSIFNGSQELNFHELETIAPMQVDADGNITGSELHSMTLICQGSAGELENYLRESGITL